MTDPLDAVYEPGPQWKKDMVGYKEASDDNMS